MTRKLGRRNMIVDAARVATLALPNTTGATATTHNPFSLGATVDDIFDISPGQVLSSDVGISQGDFIIGSSAGGWEPLSLGAASSVAYSNGTTVAWALTSVNPGAASAVLRSSATGGLQLLRLGLGATPTTNNAMDVAASGWVGLGAAKGRIEFDDTTVDEVNIRSARLGVNTGSPLRRLQVTDAGGSTLRLEYNTSKTVDLDVDSSGNLIIMPTAEVGINTLSPARRLHVTDAGGSTLRLEYNGSNVTDLDVDSSGNLIIMPTAKVGINTLSPSRRLHVLDSSGCTVRFGYNAGNYADLDVSSGGNLSIDPTGNLHLMAGSVGINTTSPARRLHVLDSSGCTLRLGYDASNYADLDVGSGGNLTVAPTGDFVFDPVGNDILPANEYDLNIGLIHQKYKALYVAELWVETLVAQETIATIGGRILVGPTTQLTQNLSNSASTIYVKHNQMDTGDIAYMEAQGKVEFISIDSDATIAGVNIVNYPDLEVGTGDDFVGWTEILGDGNIQETTIAQNGVRAVKITAGPTPSSSYLYQTVAVESGTRYTMRFWTRGDGTYAGRYQIYNETNSQNIIPSTSTGVTGTSYTMVENFFVVPDNCIAISYILRCPSTNGSIAYFDNISLSVSEYSHTVTRNLDGTGANLWWAGDAVFNTGQAGDGFIDLYSLQGVNNTSSAGPTIVGNVRNSASYNDWDEYWAIGNLNGVYGYGAASYGIGLGRYAGGYSHLTIDDGAGIRFYTDLNTVEAQLSASTWTLGRTSSEHLRLEGSSIQIKDGGTVYSQLSASAFTLGPTNAEHLRLETSAVQIKDGGTIYSQLSASAFTLGPTNAEHLRLETSAVEFRDGGTAYTQLAGCALTLGRTTTDHVSVSAASGLLLKDGAVVRGRWETDGDIFIGSNISSACTTYLSVFAGAQTYNSESMAAGDMLIGDNSDGKANILWDRSAGKILFRGGTASQTFIDTGGQFIWGNGAGRAASDGIFVTAASEWQDIRQYGFESSGSIISGLEGRYDDTHNYVRLRTREKSGKIGHISLEAAGSTSQAATILLAARYDNNTYATYLDITQGPTTPGQFNFWGGDLKINVRDVRIGGGLYVGSILTDPDSDDIWCDGELSTNSGSTRFKLGAYVGSTDTATGHIPITINGTEFRVLAYVGP